MRTTRDDWGNACFDGGTNTREMQTGMQWDRGMRERLGLDYRGGMPRCTATSPQQAACSKLELLARLSFRLVCPSVYLGGSKQLTECCRTVTLWLYSFKATCMHHYDGLNPGSHCRPRDSVKPATLRGSPLWSYKWGEKACGVAEGVGQGG